MTNKQLIQLLIKLFPEINPINFNDESDGVHWSVDIGGGDVLKDLYGRLYSLEPFFNHLGYDVAMQDDPDYFGGTVTK